MAVIIFLLGVLGQRARTLGVYFAFAGRANKHSDSLFETGRCYLPVG